MQDWSCRRIRVRTDGYDGARVGMELSTSTAIDSKCMLHSQFLDVQK